MLPSLKSCMALGLFITVLGGGAWAQASEPPEETTEEAPPIAEPAAEAPPPGPFLWLYQSIGGGVFNSGLMSRSRVHVRGPGLRNESVLFQTTYGGGGLEVGLTPAFVQVGPQLSFRPVEILDVDAYFAWTYLWRSSAGLLPFDGLTGTEEDDRKAIKHLALAGHRFEAAISPTLKLKVGPVIGLWNVEWAFIHHIKPDGATSRFTYEPRRDLVIAWDDVAVTNLAAILVEILDGTGPKGGPSPTLRVGPVMRDKQSVVSRDISTVLGGAISFRPGPKPGWPDVFFAVMGYLRDHDRALQAPQIQIQLSWQIEKSLTRRSVAREVVAALR